MAAAEHAGKTGRPALDADAIEDSVRVSLAPFDRVGTPGAENPYALHQELQGCMNDLVGIIRKSEEMAEALERLQVIKRRAQNLSVEGHRQFNPGWHLAIDLQNMILCSEFVARAAIERKESRGGHTRDDYPAADPEWGKLNIILTEDGGTVSLRHQPVPVMPAELKELFEEPAS
jgi:succinate dehydrogenase / fumarate reductase flavoprotein subunit